MSILTGIRVLDLTHFVAGPFCGQILSDYGAEVIKVEPLDGEPSRQAGPRHNDTSLYFASRNRNKRGLSIDLKSKEGKEIMQRLVKTADILVTNYGTGVPERLGIGFDEISAVNPKISMVHITGFGTTGPYKDKRALDGVIQVMSGLAELTGHPGGPPTLAGSHLADHISGLQAALGSMMALFYKERTGRGSYVDISMLDGIISMLGYTLSEVMVSGIKHERTGNSDRYGFANTFPTIDGFIYISVANKSSWEAFCKVLGKEEWSKSDSPFYNNEDRIKNQKLLVEMISEWTKQYTKEEVNQLLQDNISCGPVNTLQDVIQDPQVKHRNMIQSLNVGKDGDVFVPGVPIKINEESLTEFIRPPIIGEHSKEILDELGYSAMDIKSFCENGVINFPIKNNPILKEIT